jgi:tetratricopeptide (TPR) repeat protein
MPPWKASAESGPFIGQPRLSPADLDVLERWAATGAAQGDPAVLAAPPATTGGWPLGTPDLVVGPADAFTLPAGGSDVFRNFVIPLRITASRFVRGVEFRPGHARVVRHATLRVDRTPASRALDAADPGPGYTGPVAQSATSPDGHFPGWTPGQVAPLAPKGLAWRLRPGTDLVVEVQMQPGEASEIVQPSIGLYFGAEPPERPPVMLRLGRQSLDIAPGEAAYASEDEFVLPVDADVLAVQPHAHARATSVRAVAMLGGIRLLLIDIPRWDERWQHVYRFEKPLSLPRGAALSMRFLFDNSAGNPRNPDRPPRRVSWGRQSGDEMGDVWIQLRAHTDDDREQLVAAIRPKVLTEDAVGYERLLASGESSTALHDDLARIYLELGRPSDAARHLGASVGLSPASAAAHVKLGSALAAAGQEAEAEASFREALRLRPAYSQAHNALGSLLLGRGAAAEALVHLREAVRLDSRNMEARMNVAEAYAVLGQLARAIEAAEAALALKPAAPAARVLRERLAAYRKRQRTPR